jgi:hypothetical protein
MGCGCIVALIGMAAPRFAIFLLWLFSDRMAIAFNGFLEAFLGFLLLPFTTLFFALVYAPSAGSAGSGGSSWRSAWRWTSAPTRAAPRPVATLPPTPEPRALSRT